MICKKCNNEVSNDAKYCPICGNDLDSSSHLLCTRCNNLVSKNDRFCKNCGYDLKNNQVSSFVILNKFNFLKLANYKTFSSVLILIMSLFAIVGLFLPLFSSNCNIDDKHLDFLQVLMTQELDFNDIRSINLFSIIKLLLRELTTSRVSVITNSMANNMGIFTYLVFAISLVSLLGVYVSIIAFSILGIIKKTFYPIIKNILDFALIIPALLYFGCSFNGIGIYILTFIPVFCFVYFFVIEVFCKESKFITSKFIIKTILLFALLFVLILFKQGCDYTSYLFNNRVYKFNYQGKYTSGIISQIFIKMMFISNSSYTYSMIIPLDWISATTLLLGFLFLGLLIYSFTRLLHSFSNENISFPNNSLIISFVLFIAFFVFEYIFTRYLNDIEYNIAISEELSYYDLESSNSSAYNVFFIKKSLMFASVIYLIVVLYACIARSIYYKINHKG